MLATGHSPQTLRHLTDWSEGIENIYYANESREKCCGSNTYIRENGLYFLFYLFN